MSWIIYFNEKKSPSAYLFVKNYRKAGFFRKERIEYTHDHYGACKFDKWDSVIDALHRVKKDYPSSPFATSYTSDKWFLDHHKNRFWVIAKWDDKKASWFYRSAGKNKGIDFVESLSDATFFMTGESAKDTLALLRKKGERVTVEDVFLTLENRMLDNVFMIICTDKKCMKSRYLLNSDFNSVICVDESDKAGRFSLPQALAQYEYLKAEHKEYLYAILPYFEDNVHSMDIEQYIKSGKVSRMVAMSFCLTKNITKNEATKK